MTPILSWPGAAADAAPGGALAVWLGALAIPVLALVMYQGLGASAAIRLDAMLKQLAGDLSEEQRTQLQESMLPVLESVAGGDDPDGEYRYLLARSYMAAGRYPEAAAVYAELVDIYPEDAAIIAQSAQALYLASSRKLTPAVQALIDRAFAIDPEQLTLLGMVGMDRFQAGDYSGAIGTLAEAARSPAGGCTRCTGDPRRHRDGTRAPRPVSRGRSGSAKAAGERGRRVPVCRYP